MDSSFLDILSWKQLRDVCSYRKIPYYSQKPKKWMVAMISEKGSLTIEELKMATEAWFEKVKEREEAKEWEEAKEREEPIIVDGIVNLDSLREETLLNILNFRKIIAKSCTQRTPYEVEVCSCYNLTRPNILTVLMKKDVTTEEFMMANRGWISQTRDRAVRHYKQKVSELSERLGQMSVGDLPKKFDILKDKFLEVLTKLDCIMETSHPREGVDHAEHRQYKFEMEAFFREKLDLTFNSDVISLTDI